MAENDEAFEGNDFAMEEDDLHSLPVARPPTADTDPPQRPFTGPANSVRAKRDTFKQVWRDRSIVRSTDKTSFYLPSYCLLFHLRIRVSLQSLQTSVDGDSVVYYGRHLELTVLSTWGDPHYVGLTGLEVVGKLGEALPLDAGAITATPIESVARLTGAALGWRSIHSVHSSVDPFVPDSDSAF